MWHNTLFWIALQVGLQLLVILLPTRLKTAYVLALVLFNTIWSSQLAFLALSQESIVWPLLRVPVIGDLTLTVDTLSGFFILIINFTTTLAAVYGIGYMADQRIRVNMNLYALSFQSMHLGMLLVCMLHHFFGFLMAWELMSLASFFLVLYDYEKPDTLSIAMKYLIQMHLGVLAILVGFLWLYKQTGLFEFAALQTYFAKNPNLPLFFLFFVGFGIKAGFFPLHTWLPEAHPVAPAQVSAVMSGVMIKLGLYGILRVATYLQQDFLNIGIIVIVIGMLTALYGILNALMQHDLKKLLAYSSIENIGIMGIGIGMGLIGVGLKDSTMASLGFIGALMHILNHSMFKPLLFMGAGGVYKASHTRNIEHLGGLIHRMPISATLFLLGAIAICGLPPLNGFVSEFLLYQGIFEGLNATNVSSEVLLLITLITLTLVGGLSVFTFSKAFGLTFLGVPRSPKATQLVPVSAWMIFPQVVLVLGLISIILLPGFYFAIFLEIVGNLFVQEGYAAKGRVFFALEGDTYISLVFLAIIVVLFALRTWIVRRNGQQYGATWGCGYVTGNTRMQYTSNSYAHYFRRLGKGVVSYRENYQPIDPLEIFPASRSLQVEPHDTVETRLIQPSTQKLSWLLQQFAIIQTGRTQSYILYAFLFILILFLLTFFQFI